MKTVLSFLVIFASAPSFGSNCGTDMSLLQTGSARERVKGHLQAIEVENLSLIEITKVFTDIVPLPDAEKKAFVGGLKDKLNGTANGIAQEFADLLPSGSSLAELTPEFRAKIKDSAREAFLTSLKTKGFELELIPSQKMIRIAVDTYESFADANLNSTSHHLMRINGLSSVVQETFSKGARVYLDEHTRALAAAEVVSDLTEATLEERHALRQAIIDHSSKTWDEAFGQLQEIGLVMKYEEPSKDSVAAVRPEVEQRLQASLKKRGFIFESARTPAFGKALRLALRDFQNYLTRDTKTKLRSISGNRGDWSNHFLGRR